MRNHRGQFDRLRNGVGHDGKSWAFSKPGEATLEVHHDPNRARLGDSGVKGNIARDGAPKALHPVSIHNGMTERQRSLAGMGHANASAPDANPASPMNKEPGRKEFPAAKPVIGHRSRNAPHSAALGDAILQEAFKSSALDDCVAYRKPKL